MKCKEFSLLASGYMDGYIERNDKVEYQKHLQVCADCRSYFSELSDASSLLATLETPEVPRELRGYVMAEIRREVSGRVSFSQRIFETLIKLNPHLVSYTVGAVVSIVLFGITLVGFRPIYGIVPLPSDYAMAPIVGSDLEYHSYNNMPPDQQESSNEHDYALPRISNDSSLVSFSNIAYRKRGDEEAAALIEVGPDGKGRVVEVLQKPSDPAVLQDLQWSLSKRPFQPAMVSGKPVQTRTILLVQKVDVSG